MKTIKIYHHLPVILIILISFPSFTQAQNYNNSKNNNSAILGASSYSGGIQPVQKHVTTFGNCYAFAPSNWIITDSKREGDALGMYSADRNMYAGYLVLGIQGGLTTGYYSYMYATPETFLNYLISESGTKMVTYGEPVRDEYGYTILPFEVKGSPDVKGLVFYRVWSVPGDPYGYVLAMRIAKTVKQHWNSLAPQAISVALSIRSVVQYQSGSRGDSGSGVSDSGDQAAESGYNMQLGMEYVHDPDTGENYWVSPAKDYQETGLYGPGYYKHIGNDTKKLLPGRSDN